MKVITTIENVSKAWEILQKANLHHFLDAGMLYAVQKLSEIDLKVSDIISALLMAGHPVPVEGSVIPAKAGILIDFLACITQSDVYLTEDNQQLPWSKVDMPIAGELISAFFTDSMSVIKSLKLF